MRSVNQNAKQIYTCGLRIAQENACTRDMIGFDLLLIGRKRSTSFQSQSCFAVIQNQYLFTKMNYKLQFRYCKLQLKFYMTNYINCTTKLNFKIDFKMKYGYRELPAGSK